MIGRGGKRGSGISVLIVWQDDDDDDDDKYLHVYKRYQEIVSKVGKLNQGWLEGSLFNSYDTEV